MEMLSGDFVRGYTKAIQDMETEFKCVQDDLICYRKKMNYKFARDVLKLFKEHRENFRENQNGFIRWNVQRQELEFFNPNKSN